MKNKIFHVLYAIRLSINNLFSLIKATIDLARPVINNIGGVPLAAFAQMEADINAMGEQMNKASKSIITPQLSAMDADRDNRFAEIKRNVTTALRGRNAEKKAAAENLKIFFGPYWKTDKKAMNTQTNVFLEMSGKYNADATLKAHATTIGIDVMMSEHEAVNMEFDALYKTRLLAEAGQEGPSATSLKAAAVKSYDEFCTAIEQALNFTPSGSLTDLFNQMDELRKTYAKLVPKKGKKEEEQKEISEVE